MGSKSVKIVIIVAVILGILAIIGITALVVFTTKSSEPRVVDLNEEEITEENEVKDETEYIEETTEDTVLEDEEENREQEDNDEETENQESNELLSFNRKLLEYERNSVDGEKVNELINIIIKNNEQNQNYQIKALANVQNWDKENNKAKSDCKYKVSFEKNDEGYINVVKIEDAE